MMMTTATRSTSRRNCSVVGVEERSDLVVRLLEPPEVGVLEAQGITSAEAALALLAAQGLARLKTRDVSAVTLRRIAGSYGISSVVQSLAKVSAC
jgi:hypothetical protein